MTETIGRTTELEAVNEVLNSIGQSAVATITGDIPVDAETALNMLYGSSRDLQEEGWQFNTETAVTISLDGDSKLPIPTDALRVDGEDSINVVQRGGFLYDLDDNTFTFDEDMDVTLVRHLEWDTLPQVVRRYVIAISILKMQAAFPPPTAEYAQRAQIAFSTAKTAFLRTENANAGYNVLTNSLSVSTILRRGT